MARSYRSVTQQSLHYLLRPHDEIPQQPVPHPAAWRGDELMRQGGWQYTLDDGELDELDAAVARARQSGKRLAELAVADFPLPGLAPRIAQWRRTLGSGRGVQVVRGIPVERYSPEDCERLFFGLGLHLGVPGAQNRFEELLGHVRSEGLSYNDPGVRGYPVRLASGPSDEALAEALSDEARFVEPGASAAVPLQEALRPPG